MCLKDFQTKFRGIGAGELASHLCSPGFVSWSYMRRFLFIAVIAAQCAFAAVDATLLSFAPPSATVLTGIDVRRAENSAAGREMLRQVLSDQRLARLRGLSGLDLQREAREILLIEVGQQPGGELPYAVLARGAFTSAHVASAQRNRALVHNSQGVSVTVAPGSRDAFAFPRSSIAVIGDVAAVDAIVGHHPGIDVTLRDEAERIGAANDVWYATILSGAFLTQEVGDSLPSQIRNSDTLQHISRSYGGLQFGGTDRMTIELIAGSSSDARSMSYILRIAAGLAQLQLGGSPGFILAETILRSMQVDVDGSNLGITSSVDDQQIARALAAG